MLLALSDELIKLFQNFVHFEDQLGQLVPCRLDTQLNLANKLGLIIRSMLVRLGTSCSLSQIASQLGR